MIIKGRIIAILLISLNIFLWIFHINYQSQNTNYILFELIIFFTSLLLFWRLGKSYDIYKIQIERLETSTERLQTIFEKAAIGITLIDKTGKPIMVNPKIKEFLGYSEEELLSMTFSDLSNSEDSEKNYKLLNQLLNKEIDSYSLEKRYIKKDGQIVWGQVTSSLFPNKDGEFSYIIGMVIDITEKKMAEQRLLEMNNKLEYLSNSDGLTGIANRRYFNKYLLQEWEKTVINGVPLSLILFDIDFFKKYNDTYGHLAGDICLKNVAAILNKLTELKSCLSARFGGEEFAIILPGANAGEVKQIAEKIRSSIEDLKFPHANSKASPYVTISVGAATMIPGPDTKACHQELIRAADVALYQAKKDGRNRVCLYHADEEMVKTDVTKTIMN